MTSLKILMLISFFCYSSLPAIANDETTLRKISQRTILYEAFGGYKSIPAFQELEDPRPNGFDPSEEEIKRNIEAKKLIASGLKKLEQDVRSLKNKKQAKSFLKNKLIQIYQAYHMERSPEEIDEEVDYFVENTTKEEFLAMITDTQDHFSYNYVGSLPYKYYSRKNDFDVEALAPFCPLWPWAMVYNYGAHRFCDDFQPCNDFLPNGCEEGSTFMGVVHCIFGAPICLLANVSQLAGGTVTLGIIVIAGAIGGLGKMGFSGNAP